MQQSQQPTTNQPTQRFGQLAGNAGRAFSSFATSSLQNLTTRRYTLPDKSVASQVLMYRQLLHTKCKPGLKLSREYQGTPAQKAVLHMPWWEEGIEETKKMVISYDNLIVRLWLNGAIMPHVQTSGDDDEPVDKASIDTLVDEQGLPPIPHDYWVDRLGFQQPDPVTDFRSGGVLSLAMMVHVVEACPAVHERFVAPKGDASVLPFGITCINVTDMLSKFCMLAKSVDRMDALLSQKPFWRMFADPNSILALQELSLDMLADVVVELREERLIPGYCAPDDNKNDSVHKDENDPGKVTVFDFSIIMERTEKRVEKDLLGAGPKSVEELRAVRAKLKHRYRFLLDRTRQRTEQLQKQQQQKEQAAAEGATDSPDGINNIDDTNINSVETPNSAGGGIAGIRMGATNVASGATSMAAGMFAKISSPGFSALRKTNDGTATADGTANSEQSAALASDTGPDLMAFSASDDADDADGDWVQSPMSPPTDAIEHFSIDDDDDML